MRRGRAIAPEVPSGTTEYRGVSFGIPIGVRSPSEWKIVNRGIQQALARADNTRSEGVTWGSATALPSKHHTSKFHVRHVHFSGSTVGETMNSKILSVSAIAMLLTLSACATSGRMATQPECPADLCGPHKAATPGKPDIHRPQKIDPLDKVDQSNSDVFGDAERPTLNESRLDLSNLTFANVISGEPPKQHCFSRHSQTAGIGSCV
jgi:hypothetical protein